MQEFLFYQDKKHLIPQQKPIFAPNVSKDNLDEHSTDGSVLSQDTSMSQTMGSTMGKGMKKNKFRSDMGVNQPGLIQKKKPIKEFSEESLKKSFDQMSAGYEDQYIEAGFPPKICATIIDKLNTNEQKHKVHILDIGCGKGFLGQYLKDEGFMKTTGMDCSNSIMEIAKDKNCYHKLERLVFGQKETVIPDEMKGFYTFVSAATILNNDGYDMKIFRNMIDCCKENGFIVFATKLDFHQQNQYEPEITELEQTGYWRFTSEHSFYRYDKLCDKVGKFSTKLVKILCYQKIDRAIWLAEKVISDKLKENELLAELLREKEAEDAKNQRNKFFGR